MTNNIKPEIQIFKSTVNAIADSKIVVERYISDLIESISPQSFLSKDRNLVNDIIRKIEVITTSIPYLSPSLCLKCVKKINDIIDNSSSSLANETDCY